MTTHESKGGKPSTATPKDRRLAANRGKAPAKPAKAPAAPKKPFPGAAAPFKPKASPAAKPKKG